MIYIEIDIYIEGELLFELRIQSFLDGFGFHFLVSPRHQVDLHKGVGFSKRVHLLKIFALDNGDLELTFSIIVAQLSRKYHFN